MTEGTNKIISGALRVIALLLCLLCARYAWAGIPFFRAYQSMQGDEYGDSAELFSKARSLGLNNLQTIHWQGLSEYKNALERKDIHDYEEAMQTFSDLLKKYPRHSKSYVYRTLSEAAALQMKDKKPTGEQLNQWKADLQKARELEPYDPWIAFHAASIYLSQPMGDDDRSSNQRVLDWLTYAAESLPERYLKPSMQLLLQYTGDIADVVRWTPRNYESYKQLLEFLGESNEWKTWVGAYPVYSELRDSACRSLIEEGDGYYASGKYKAAERAYRNATWIDPDSDRAKLSLMIAQYKLGHFEKTDWSPLLKRILEEGPLEDKYAGSAGEIVEEINEPYLSGLLAYRMGHWPQALELFSKKDADGKYLSLYKALALLKQGQPKAAQSMILERIESKEPDPRELLAAIRLFPDLSQKAREEAVTRFTRSKKAESWWSQKRKNNRLSEKSRTGALLNLDDSPSKIHFAVRNTGDQPAVLTARLGERFMGVYFVDAGKWERFSFERNGPAGSYWFSLELFNGLSSDSGPSVEIGSLIIEKDEEAGTEREL